MNGPPPIPQVGCCLEGFDAPSVKGAEAQGPTCMHVLSGLRGRLSAHGVDVLRAGTDVRTTLGFLLVGHYLDIARPAS